MFTGCGPDVPTNVLRTDSKNFDVCLHTARTISPRWELRAGTRRPRLDVWYMLEQPAHQRMVPFVVA